MLPSRPYLHPLPEAYYLPYSATRRFSNLVIDYLQGSENVATFFSYSPDESGIMAAVNDRKQFPVNRAALCEVLYEQYKNFPDTESVLENIALLKDENTFTICTAHQPNLGTGYLYFVYKILHAIKLAAELNQQISGSRFVPVYYMGSEDADLEELGTFRFRDKKFVWDAGSQSGAVGRMNTDSLQPLLQELFKLFGPPGIHKDRLEALLIDAYEGHTTIAEATQFLVHGLFGKYGLIVLNPDHALLKKEFVPVMKADLLEHPGAKIVEQTIGNMQERSYKAQAQPRRINLFYLKDNIRARIEKHDQKWLAVDTHLSWTKEELLTELKLHPERFSPNVILRPLYQEIILPNVAFIGGGAEVAYWLLLKDLFQYHQVFYPTVLLRQSIQWIHNEQSRLWKKTGLTLEEVFSPQHEAEKAYVYSHAERDWHLEEEMVMLEQFAERLRSKAASADPTLEQSADATIARIKHLMKALEEKILKAEKLKLQTGLNQVSRLQEAIFPGGTLQERVDNFMPFYLEYGPDFFDEILHKLEPLRNEFLVLEIADPQGH